MTPEQQAALDRAIAAFPFDEVRAYMLRERWRWGGRTNGRYPSTAEMATNVRELARIGGSDSGGFRVTLTGSAVLVGFGMPNSKKVPRPYWFHEEPIR